MGVLVRFKSFQEGLRKLLFGRMPKEQFDKELLASQTEQVRKLQVATSWVYHVKNGSFLLIKYTVSAVYD